MNLFDFQPINIYIGLAIIGTFSGLGNALGQYFFQKYMKRHLDKLSINGKEEVSASCTEVDKVDEFGGVPKP